MDVDGADLDGLPKVEAPNDLIHHGHHRVVPAEIVIQPKFIDAIEMHDEIQSLIQGPGIGRLEREGAQVIDDENHARHHSRSG